MTGMSPLEWWEDFGSPPDLPGYLDWAWQGDAWYLVERRGGTVTRLRRLFRPAPGAPRVEEWMEELGHPRPPGRLIEVQAADAIEGVRAALGRDDFAAGRVPGPLISQWSPEWRNDSDER